MWLDAAEPDVLVEGQDVLVRFRDHHCRVFAGSVVWVQPGSSAAAVRLDDGDVRLHVPKSLIRSVGSRNRQRVGLF